MHKDSYLICRYPFRNRSGLALLPTILLFVLLGVMIATGIKMLLPVIQRAKVTSSRSSMEKGVQAIISWSITNGRLPKQTEITSILPTSNDAWGKPFVYLYDADLADATKGGLCGRTSTSASYSTVPLAFVLLSAAEDGVINSSPSASGVLPTTTTYTGLSSNDHFRAVPLEELKSRAGCYGSTGGRLRIINNELPKACASSTNYSAQLFATGGVPDYSSGTPGYTWELESSPSWIGIHPTTGQLTPSASITATAGAYTITAKATDNHAPDKTTVKRTYTLQVVSCGGGTAATGNRFNLDLSTSTWQSSTTLATATDPTYKPVGCMVINGSSTSRIGACGSSRVGVFDGSGYVKFPNVQSATGANYFSPQSQTGGNNGTLTIGAWLKVDYTSLALTSGLPTLAGGGAQAIMAKFPCSSSNCSSQTCGINQQNTTANSYNYEWIFHFYKNGGLYFELFSYGGSAYFYTSTYSLPSPSGWWPDSYGTCNTYDSKMTHVPCWHYLAFVFDYPNRKYTFYVLRPDLSDMTNKDAPGIWESHTTYNLPANYPPPPSASNGPLLIGGVDGYKSPLTGMLAGVVVDDRALTQEQLKAIAKANWPDSCGNGNLDTTYMYSTALTYKGSSIIGDNATILISGPLTASDLNGASNLAVSNIYINGSVSLNQSQILGSSTYPGIIYINGDLTLQDNAKILGKTIFVTGNLSLNGSAQIGSGASSTVVVRGSSTLANGVMNATLYNNVDLSLTNATINYTSYTNNNLTLGWTPTVNASYLYYHGTLSVPSGYPSSITSKCVYYYPDQPALLSMPNSTIPTIRPDSWFGSNGYTASTNSKPTSNAKIFASSSYSYSGWIGSDISNVVIVSKGNISLDNIGGKVSGVLFAPNGTVTLGTNVNFEGWIVAKNGLIQNNWQTVVLKPLSNYITDTNAWPFTTP